jgi:hypothetical protein
MYYLIIINFVAAVIIGLLGMNRKMGFWGYFFSTLFFTPIIGIVLVLASDPRKPENQEKNV